MRRFVALLRSAWVEYERDHARYFAAAMVYYALVSLVPMLLLLLAGLGLLLRYSAFAASAELQVLDTIESGFGPEIRTTMGQLLDRLQQESIVATFVSLAGLMLSASVLFNHLRLTFRAIWRHPAPLVSGPPLVAVRAKFLERAKAFAMLATSGVLLVAAIAMFTAFQWLIGLFERAPLARDAANSMFALAGTVIVVICAFAFLFRFLPPLRLEWRHVWRSAALCAAVWITAAEILALYGACFGRSSAFGAIGSALAIMLWMYLVSQLLFYGAELCKVVVEQESRWSADP